MEFAGGAGFGDYSLESRQSVAAGPGASFGGGAGQAAEADAQSGHHGDARRRGDALWYPRR